MDDQDTRRRALLRLTAWLGLAALSHDWSALRAADGHGQEPRKTDPMPREVVAEVTFPARRIAAGEKVPFAFKITNNSPRTVVLWSCGFWPNHLVEVWDAAGRAVPLTSEGKLRKQSFAPGGVRRKNVPIELKPGESWPRPLEGEDPAKRREGGGLGLDGLFELKPGTFKVIVTYHDEQPPTPLKVASPEMTFEVTPPDAKRQAPPGVL